MSAVVLYDGSAGATRCVEFAGLPGNLLPSHDGCQLILVHAWDRERQSGAHATAGGGTTPGTGSATPAEGVAARWRSARRSASS
ncbi:hypothetical protein STCU_10872 [Strigomonas culicis]|uniref:Uncharacterized protein n=1 Tax=Strigomonas culicis TaxID=28005 RepID=S9UQR7_9TRYP|nr:hypothetical protein STCU_10872 [Strigomonas culicis]|eukprot:EPY16981.1 hypothetical protein STCU_10872 [Strigomonas culicis]